MKNKKKLHKSSKSKMLCGVCGGFAEFFNIDVTIVRIIAVVLALIRGLGILLYLILAVIMPGSMVDDEGNEYKTEESDFTNKQSQKKNNSTQRGTENGPHSDEEFDSYFSKKN